METKGDDVTYSKRKGECIKLIKVLQYIQSLNYCSHDVPLKELRTLLWDVRGQWNNIAIQLGLSLGTREVTDQVQHKTGTFIMMS